MIYINLISKASRYASKIIKKLVLLGPYYILKKHINKIFPKKIKKFNAFSVNKKDKIIILSPGHTLYVAKLINITLNESGFNSIIITKEPKKYEDLLYIIICPQIYKNLPSEKTIFFQMEQFTSKRWFNKKYYNILNKASLIVDYSLDNINMLISQNIHISKILYVPISYINQYNNENKDLIIFYGDTSSPRRKKIINSLQRYFNISIINNKFGKEIENILSRTKIVLNIHYYENSILETTRIYEALSFGCIVISEESLDIDKHDNLKGIVDFVKIGDVDAIFNIINKYSTNSNLFNLKLEKIKRFISSKENIFKYFFQRMLLYCDIIDFDKFYNLSSKNISIINYKICLNLPEDTIRSLHSKKISEYGFEFFPAVRHPIAWIGCGLSYKFLMRYFLEKDFNYTVICEDDAIFPENFDKRFRYIEDYLISNLCEWEIFSGFIADISEDINILKIININSDKLIYINKSVSTVFNCYSKKAMKILALWDENTKEKNNTIDRYIEKNNLTTITTLPFLVIHSNNLNSTLWECSNKEYIEMTINSISILKNKIHKFKHEIK